MKGLYLYLYLYLEGVWGIWRTEALAALLRERAGSDSCKGGTGKSRGRKFKTRAGSSLGAFQLTELG